MIKEITLCVPKYVLKFILSEPDYECISQNVVKVPRLTEIGHLIHGFSCVIPYNQNFATPEPPKLNEVVTFQYNCKKKAFDVPVNRYVALRAFLIEQFRASLIREVSTIHVLHSDSDYGWMVRSFLERRGIVVDDSKDKDMEWETAKKIYRDHLERVSKKNQRNSKLSKPSLSGLQRVCLV